MVMKSSFMLQPSKSSRRYLSEINVTPLVDVMLVLLVIFMVTAPMLVTGIDVDLPDAHAKNLASDEEPLEITLDADNNIFLGEAPISREDFLPAIRGLAATSAGPESRRVFVRADESLSYGGVMLLVSQIADAGFTKVAFVSEPVADPTNRVVQ